MIVGECSSVGVNRSLDRLTVIPPYTGDDIETDRENPHE